MVGVDVQDMGIKLSKLSDKLYVEKCWVDVVKIRGPPDCLRARDLDEGHIQEVYSSMLEHGLRKPDIRLCSPNWPMLDNGKPQVLEEKKLNTTPDLVLEAFVGDHTRAALQRIITEKKELPGLPDWHKKVMCEIFHYNPLNPDDVFVLKGMGSHDNIIKGIHKPMDTWSKIKSIHSDIVNWGMKYSEEKEDYGLSPMKGDEKAYWTSIHGLKNPGQLRNMLCLARLPQEWWDLVFKVCDGKTDHSKLGKKFKAQASDGWWSKHYCPRLFYTNQEELFSLLKRLVSGELELKGFQNKCKDLHFKNILDTEVGLDLLANEIKRGDFVVGRDMVPKPTEEFLQKWHAENGGEATPDIRVHPISKLKSFYLSLNLYTALKYPSATNDTFLNNWLPAFKKAKKADMHEAFRMDLWRRIRLDNSALDKTKLDISIPSDAIITNSAEHPQIMSVIQSNYFNLGKDIAPSHFRNFHITYL